MKQIICLSGFARSGKDEAAKVLIEKHGFTRVAFADKLRDMLYALNPYVVEHVYNAAVPLQTVIDRYGWNGYKSSEYETDIRRLLQRLGTEAGRQTLWDTIWIDAALAGVEADKIVVTDGRFFNEFDAVRERGGTVWRIERPGVEARNSHASETEAVGYPHFEYRLDNDGSVEDWHQKVSDVYESWLDNGGTEW